MEKFMKKTFKKLLIYLLFAVLMVPTWLVTGMLNATHAKANSTPQVVINEFVPNPASGNEWIELYNGDGSAVNLDGWYIKDNTLTSICTFDATKIITPNGYLSCETSGKLNDAGDVLSLYDNSGSGIALDSHAYDKNPGSGKSIGRAYDGASDWVVFGNPSKGSANSIADLAPTTGNIILQKGESFSFNMITTPNAGYKGVSGLITQVNSRNFDQIFSQFDLTTNDITENKLIPAAVVNYPANIDLTYGSFITTKIDLTVINTDITGDFNFSVSLVNQNGQTISNIANFQLTIKDTTAPIITLNGGDDITIELGSTYNELGATATDNKDGDLTAQIVATGSVDTTTLGDYPIKYEVTDAAGNKSIVTRTVRVVETVIASPQINITLVDRKMTVSWNEVGGATDYLVFIGTSTSNWIINGVSTNGAKSYTTTFASYGNYVVRVLAVKNSIRSGVSDGINQKSITAQYVAPVQEEETVVEVPTVAPETAIAQEPQPAEQKIETPQATDDEGEIKGDEEAAGEEDINWTPWIVLFVLIILAGAATGGYFYWFSGEDEVSTVVKNVKEKPAEKEASPVKKSNKKIKRW